LLQTILVGDVVSIHSRDYFSTTLWNCIVRTVRKAWTFVPLENLDPWILSPPFPNYVGGTIGRTVIKNNEFIILKCLTENARNALREEGSSVVDRHNNTELWRVHYSLFAVRRMRTKLFSDDNGQALERKTTSRYGSAGILALVGMLDATFAQSPAASRRAPLRACLCAASNERAHEHDVSKVCLSWFALHKHRCRLQSEALTNSDFLRWRTQIVWLRVVLAAVEEASAAVDRSQVRIQTELPSRGSAAANVPCESLEHISCRSVD